MTPAPVAIEVLLLGLTLREAHVAAHGTEETRETVLVRAVLGDGTEGWGECPALTRPTYTPEYARGAFALLRDVLAPAAVAAGEPPGGDLVGHPMALAGLRGALLDARLRCDGRSLAAALGVTRPDVVCTAVVSGTSAEEVVRRVAERLDEGYVHVSVKVIGRDGLDVLRAVRDAWPRLSLAADANGSTCDESLVAEIDALGLRYLEQPCPSGAWDRMASFAARAATPVALDESIGDPDDVVRAGDLRAGRVLNLKPARFGGVIAARSVLPQARESGFETFCGGLLESGIGRAHALAFAALDECTLPTQLGPSAHYYDEDVITEPFVLGPGATLTVPRAPGIGVLPDVRRLARVTIDRALVTRA